MARSAAGSASHGASHDLWAAAAQSREEFIEGVSSQAPGLYRSLPWRGIDDPYGVLVSEVMLQQTQVSRVLRYWPRWLELFPSLDALAAADTATVLEVWQGLGYNRRALALKRAAEFCAEHCDGQLPQDYEGLLALPGIGPATAAGVRVFAHNEPAVYLETNVRSVFLHELFPDEQAVADKQLIPYVEDTCPRKDPRTWYYGLLDLGAHLKSQGVNPSRRSKHYARQSAFKGSHREKRSFLLKLVLATPEGIAASEALSALNDFEASEGRPALSGEAFDDLVNELSREGFFRCSGERLVS